MTGLNLDNVLFVYMTSKTDDAQMESDELYDMPDPETRDWREAMKSKAKNYDHYRSIVHISTLRGNEYVHIVNNPEAKATNSYSLSTPAHANTSLLWEYPYELNVLEHFWRKMIADPSWGLQAIIAGWQLELRDLPLLVHKAVAQNIPLPFMYKADPTKRYYDVDALLRVQAIYQQGAGSVTRPVPPLSDVLDHWTIPNTDTEAYPVVSDIIKWGIMDWKTFGFRQVERYLYGMQCMVKTYYDLP